MAILPWLYYNPSRLAPPFLFSLSLSLSLPQPIGAHSLRCASHSFSHAVVSILLISVDTDFALSIPALQIESRHSIVIYLHSLFTIQNLPLP